MGSHASWPEAAQWRAQAGENRPMHHVTRDSFSFVGIGSLHAMETKPCALYVAPLVGEKEFRNDVKLSSKLVLTDQSHKTMQQLRAETAPAVQRNLYWQLRQINETLDIPTEAADVLLSSATPALLVGQEGGAA